MNDLAPSLTHSRTQPYETGLPYPELHVTPGAWRDMDAVELELIVRLDGAEPSTLRRARAVLSLLGDPGRRTILERLAGRSETAGHRLPELTGMESINIYHRLRRMLRAKLVSKDRYHRYQAEPEALRGVSRYFDLLALAASRWAVDGPSERADEH